MYCSVQDFCFSAHAHCSFNFCLGVADSVPPLQTLLAERIAELAALFLSQRKRTGGSRANQIAETWATILARRDLGESLQVIAEDLKMPYETVKTYAKLARQELRKLQ